MAFYRRHLPHLHFVGHPVFVTFRLHGSLPPNKWSPQRDSATFQAMDAALDRPEEGPLWLQLPKIALIVVEAIDYNASRLNHFEMHAFAVMANHVHLLLTPSVPLPKLMHSLKSITAQRANQALERTGQPFWQAESFDHLIRNDAEFRRITRYIHQNPVKAGLVSNPEDFPWSSASRSVGQAPSPPLEQD